MSEERELKDQRIPIMMTESEVTAIDDWSFKYRIRSRGEAIRRLCQIGINYDAQRTEIEGEARAAGEAVDALVKLVREGLAKEQRTQLERNMLRAAALALGATLKTEIAISKATDQAHHIMEVDDIKELFREVADKLDATADDEEEIDINDLGRMLDSIKNNLTTDKL